MFRLGNALKQGRAKNLSSLPRVWKGFSDEQD